MLWEMMNGDVIEGGWKSEEVKNSLDLCLSCKGCKHDCPVNVDMATYKAEFLSHYYRGKIRPRHAFAFGFIHVWAVLASKAPTIANLFTQMPGVSALAKWIAGASQHRQLPAFAPESFKEAWFRKHRKSPARTPGRTRVVLFADTFSNYFVPETAKSAVAVLEDADFEVELPTARPLLRQASPTITDVHSRPQEAAAPARCAAKAIQPEVQADLPVVVLEPSCGGRCSATKSRKAVPNAQGVHSV